MSERNATWLGDDPDDMKRVRPKADKLKLSRKMRRAELVCPDAGDTPMLLGIVYPRDVPIDRMVLLIQQGHPSLGQDFKVWCRCGRDHQIDGGKFRSEVQVSTLRSGRVPVIPVGSVERGNR